MLLADQRLVTLTGPGGSGKTRLSKQVAEAVVDSFPDGIYFVDLSAVEDAGLVIGAILTVLGVHQAQGVAPLDLAVTALSRSQACLILDNLEQVIDAKSDVAALLAGTQNLKIIATSRGPLHIGGEQEYSVPPLAVPGDGDPALLVESEAVQLFSSRARDIDPGFVLDAESAVVIGEIVTRLDGLPLAIELAAARTRLLSLPDLLVRLGSSLDVLRSRRSDLPERQQTLRGAIQWSYDLLDGEHQRLLADFSVFAGGCRLKELVSVCAPGYAGLIEDLLEDVIEQSLVRRQGTRYGMLQTIREFALEKLLENEDEAELRDRHATAYRDLAEFAAPKLLTVDRPMTLNLLADDHENLRAAIDWSTETGNVDVALALGAALWRFWQMRGHLPEAKQRLVALTGLDGGDPVLKAQALEGLGGVAYWQADFSLARDAYQAGLDLLRECGTEDQIANSLYNLSFSCGFAGDSDTAVALLGEADAIYRSLGDTTGLGHIAWGRGNMHYVNGNFEKSRDLFIESADKLRGGADDFSYGWAVDRLGVVESALGEIDEARRWLVEALDLFTVAEDISAMAIIFNDLAGNALHGGDEARALRIDGAVAELRRRSGAHLVAASVNAVEGMDEAAESVGPERAAALRAEGNAMSFLEALAYVRDES